MDITLGSGRQGQTYLFWQENVLFQLPVSYHAPSDSWSNSPGYPTDQILFNRSVSARCLECHATYFKSGKPTDGNETFDRKQVMLGVDCERCHGPAARHVTFHLKNPSGRKATISATLPASAGNKNLITVLFVIPASVIVLCHPFRIV